MSLYVKINEVFLVLNSVTSAISKAKNGNKNVSIFLVISLVVFFGLLVGWFRKFMRIRYSKHMLQIVIMVFTGGLSMGFYGDWEIAAFNQITKN